ncbi:uncharacterized protein B0I36DRAFT_377282 [Microdochium trichocladiopsis]|uniref:ER-bound oxygenase mpaB/mpaB'/Rubber oxygenase catalytic domain-containing protein n=1 Tax=Microdochium trichocladiopsis TaxID=1682393 RepID=A0A9P8XXW2_9PEZI|nr:uncharacterized protein B0I36DRAFT_377282 [Microdochium trichocladiopsis]KAH7021422.1 hypothetical protein B0I36DRAFT_377282 [Microdochium trichocladiopsis]
MNLIIQESVILGAGAAAILLQVAEPGVAAGVNEHSNFAERVGDRLRTTMTYVYCVGFGTPSEKRAIANAVTRVHKHVNGVLNEGERKKKGQRYSALDPELQLWVAATLYYTGLDIYQRVFGPIEDEHLHEEIYHEYAVIAISLQVPPEMWPRDRRAFLEYWDAKVAQLQVTQHAREVARDLLYLPRAPWYLRVLTPSLRCLTAELLPPRIREYFGLRSNSFWYHVHMLGLRAVYRWLPLMVRSLPVRYYLWDMRRRLSCHRPVFHKGIGS